MTTMQACVFLFGAATLYNLAISRVIRVNPGHGLTALWVVLGVLLVLSVSALIVDAGPYYWHWGGRQIPLSNGQLAAWLFLRLFACAGTPMVLGSLWRRWRLW